MQARLADKLTARNWESLRGARPVAEPGEWRHQSIPAQRPAHFPRPPAERRIIRHKAFAVAQETVDEAAFDMELADYDFFLCTDAATGADRLLDRGRARKLPRGQHARRPVIAHALCGPGCGLSGSAPAAEQRRRPAGWS